MHCSAEHCTLDKSDHQQAAARALLCTLLVLLSACAVQDSPAPPCPRDQAAGCAPDCFSDQAAPLGASQHQL